MQAGRFSNGEGNSEIAAVGAGENHVVCEERTPFARWSVIGVVAADEFVNSIEFSDKLGVPERGDDRMGSAETKECGGGAERFF